MTNLTVSQQARRRNREYLIELLKGIRDNRQAHIESVRKELQESSIASLLNPLEDMLSLEVVDQVAIRSQVAALLEDMMKGCDLVFKAIYVNEHSIDDAITRLEEGLIKRDQERVYATASTSAASSTQQ